VSIAAAMTGLPRAVADPPDAPSGAGWPSQQYVPLPPDMAAPQQYLPLPPGMPAPNPMPAQGPAPGTPPDQDAEGKSSEARAKKPEAKGEGEKSGEAEKKDDETAAADKCWNFHAQTTVVAQGDPGFPAKYSGPNSLNSAGERQETLAADLFVGRRLWCGAEMHADALMWQGFGLTNTFGIEAFSNGDDFKAGTEIPDFMFAHLIIRQTFGLGGEQEDVSDGQLSMAGKQDISRLTFTVGRFTPTDICDNNTYAKDPHTQFLNWAACANLTWDYPSDSVGYTTGVSVELNQPQWALRYGFFQMPGVENGFTADDRIFKWPGEGSGGDFWKSWGMMTELERRWKVNDHPGALRLMAWLDEARFASFVVATALLRASPPLPGTPAGASSTVPAAAFADRCKYGFGLNWEQELAKNVGVFSRLGCNDGHEVAWTYTDANWAATLGLSVKGAAWHRPDDIFGLLGVLDGASHEQIAFLKAGGTGILNGDGNLTYACEKVLETYYDIPMGKAGRFAFDYQFVGDPAFNSDRGPVSIFAVRLHWEF
jgi:high affinity Mn2+ porin